MFMETRRARRTCYNKCRPYSDFRMPATTARQRTRSKKNGPCVLHGELTLQRIPYTNIQTFITSLGCWSHLAASVGCALELILLSSYTIGCSTAATPTCCHATSSMRTKCEDPLVDPDDETDDNTTTDDASPSEADDRAAAGTSPTTSSICTVETISGSICELELPGSKKTRE